MSRNITHERLLELVHYEPTLGLFWHKPRPVQSRHDRMFNTRFADKIAGTMDGHGYVSIRLEGDLYKGHQLAWFYMTGEWPEDEIDHRNLSRIDNSFDNLRPATRSQNMANRKPSGSSGIRGVDFSKGAWRARVKKDGITEDLGRHSTPEAAKAAFDKRAAEIHGQFARPS